MLYDNIYIGSNLLHIFKILKDKRNNRASILIEADNELGGAWRAHKIQNRIVTEMGGHILYKNRLAFYKLKMCHGINVKLLNPQPQVKIAENYLTDDKLTMYLYKDKKDNLILSLIKIIKYGLERWLNGSHFYFNSGVIPLLTQSKQELSNCTVNGRAIKISKSENGYKVFLSDGTYYNARRVEISRASVLNEVVGVLPKYDTIHSRNVFLVTDGPLNIRGFISFGIPTYAQFGKKNSKSDILNDLRLVRLSELTAYSTGLLTNENVYCISIICSDYVWENDDWFDKTLKLLVLEGFVKISDIAKIKLIDKADYKLNRMNSESLHATINTGITVNDVTDMAKAIRKYL